MVMRRCPKCHSTGDDQYGFCIKCGYEYPKMEATPNTCPLCGYENPDEADYCVKCGSPLIFKNQGDNPNNPINPIIIRRIPDNPQDMESGTTSKIIIVHVTAVLIDFASCDESEDINSQLLSSIMKKLKHTTTSNAI